MEYGLTFNATNLCLAAFGRSGGAHQDRTVTQKKQKHKTTKSQHRFFFFCGEVRMLYGLLTSTALTAAVKLMGSSCPSGDWKLFWRFSTAHVRALDSSREGNLKTVFGESSAAQRNTVQGARVRLTPSSISSKNRWVYLNYFSISA